MKLQLLLTFAFVSPLILFLATIMYGGITTTDLKKGVVDSGAYVEIGKYIEQQDADTIGNNQHYSVLISKNLNSNYFQTKTEKVIDDSSLWITGKTNTAPTISFKEIKEELQQDNGFLNNVKRMPEIDVKQSDLNREEQAMYVAQQKQLIDFINGDLTISLADQMQGVKLVYSILQIALPILIGLLIVILFLIAKQAANIPSKCKWVGSTLLVSSIVGYICILLHQYITMALMELRIFQESNLALFTPIILAIINYFVEAYINYQEIVNAIFLVGAAICFLGAIITRKMAPPKTTPVYNVKSYWETPVKEETSFTTIKPKEPTS